MRQGSRGFVLTPVLWMLIFLGALAGTALRFTQAGASSVQAVVDQIRLEDMTRSAIAAGLSDMNMRRLAAIGTSDLRFSDGTVTLAWTSETARVDLNLATPDLLRALFLASGAEPSDADDYVKRVLQRRDFSRASGGPIAIAFAHPDEIAVLRLPARISARVRQFSTVYGVSGTIDPRIASDALLASLPGMTEMMRRTLVQASDMELAAIKSREADGIGTMIDISPPRVIRFHIEAQLGSKHMLRSEIVLVRFFDDAEPFRILHWRTGAEPHGRNR